MAIKTVEVPYGEYCNGCRFLETRYCEQIGEVIGRCSLFETELSAYKSPFFWNYYMKKCEDCKRTIKEIEK